MTHLMDVDIAVIGAGIGGLATARELARRAGGRIALVERRILAGAHATGRNAALILQNVDDETGYALAREGARFYADPPADLPVPIPFHRTGSLLLYSGTDSGPSVRDTDLARGRGADVAWLDPVEAQRRVPILETGAFRIAAFCAGDGVLDIDALVRSFLADAEGRGVQRIDARALAIRTARGAVAGIDTDAGTIGCRTVVNAAGPWAGALGETAGAPLPLRPTRRHLVVTSPLPAVDPSWPFVWDLDRPFYFRPDSGGLLLCPCDVTDAADLDETPRPEWIATTLSEARRRIPRAGPLDAAWAWAGLRTLTPDNRFVIGFDGRVKGLFWVAGLGGHGITCGPAVGRLAADLILAGRTGMVDAELVAPGRFS